MKTYIDLAPSPASLIESMRNIGYSIQTSIADLIDNSITAGANKINIRFSWNSGDPWLAIIDNGCGMTKDELVNAMRFGSANPLELRSNNDLGRFGLGMKTASLSQCRHLIVASKKSDYTWCCEWNLDELSGPNQNGWQLGVFPLTSDQNNNVLQSLAEEAFTSHEYGTIVFWKNMDRVKEQIPQFQQEVNFNALLYNSRAHLELTFHRFLSPDPGKKKVSLLMNNDELMAFNPFNPNNLATQELPEQQIILDGEPIIVQPYILPHHNKVSQQEYEKYSGEGGYLQNQGFYVYRNRRLIINGTWFNLIKKEELNKLIRIRVDIPNSLDYLWKIDIKKSSASPPESIKRELRIVIFRIEGLGHKVFHQKGKKLAATIIDPVWNRIVSSGRISYQINRSHPLIIELLKYTTTQQKSLFFNLITMFESSFPVDLFFNDIASNPKHIDKPEFNQDDLETLMDFFFQSWKQSGIPENEYQEKLLSTDPFASNQIMTKNILKQRGYEIE
jgi:hypothetical protein